MTPPKPTAMPTRRTLPRSIALATPPTPPIVVLAAGTPPCFECWEGKHWNCLNKTWDGEPDHHFTRCPCAKAGHPRQLSAHQKPK